MKNLPHISAFLCNAKSKIELPSETMQLLLSENPNTTITELTSDEESDDEDI